MIKMAYYKIFLSNGTQKSINAKIQIDYQLFRLI